MGSFLGGGDSGARHLSLNSALAHEGLAAEVVCLQELAEAGAEAEESVAENGATTAAAAAAAGRAVRPAGGGAPRQGGDEPRAQADVRGPGGEWEL